MVEWLSTGRSGLRVECVKEKFKSSGRTLRRGRRMTNNNKKVGEKNIFSHNNHHRGVSQSFDF